jgi:hypothetical protein
MILARMLMSLAFFFSQQTIPQHTGATAGTSGGVTWTVSQHPRNFTCSASAAGNLACSVTATSTGAGHLLILASSSFELQTGTNHTAPSFVSASGDSTWTHCPASYSHIEYITNNYQAGDCAYILSAAGGATSLTFTWSFPATTTAANVDVEFYEVIRSTGTATYDTGNTATSASCSSCTAPTLTLGGSDDYIAQWLSQGGGISSVASPYSNPFDNDTSNVFGAFAGALNQSSGTGPVWTCTAGGAALSGVAFK